jgi:hypothetical protein
MNLSCQKGDRVLLGANSARNYRYSPDTVAASQLQSHLDTVADVAA